MSSIRWTAQERSAVENEFKKIIKGGNNNSLIEAILTAQMTCVPIDRRRNKHSLYNEAYRIMDVIKQEETNTATSQSSVCDTAQLLSKGQFPKQVIVEPAIPVQQEVVQASTPTVVQAQTPIVVQQPHALATIASNIFADMQTEISKSVSDLVGAYEQRLRAMAMEEIQAQVDHALKSVVVDIRKDVDLEFQRRLKAATPKVKANSLYKVLIVGLIPAQKADIIKEYGDSLNLDFVFTNEHLGRLKALKDGADFVLVMRKFVNHNHTDIVNKTNHKGFIMINGGMTELGQSLLEIACK